MLRASAANASHQRRIPKSALHHANEKLLDQQEAIRSAADFEELLTIIASALRTVARTGELYRYDTALRISYCLQLLPTKVYLHAGTRTGARALGLPHHQASIPTTDLPPELAALPAHEVEDILCIYKKQLQDPSARAKETMTFQKWGSKPTLAVTP